MGWGGGPAPHCSCHFNSQLLMTSGVGWDGLGGPTPHCSCHFNSQHLMTNGGWRWGSCSSLLMSLQLSVPDDKGEGWGSCSSLLMSLQLSTPDDQWGGVGVFRGFLLLIAHVTSTLNAWWPRGRGGVGGSSPCSCHFNSQLLMISGVGCGRGSSYLIAHLTNQVDSSSAVKRNWLPSLYASTG